MSEKLKPGWTRVAFGDVVERVESSGVPTAEESRTYIGLEHLDSGSYTVSRWGSHVALVVPKTLVKKGDVLFARRNTHLKRCALAPFDCYFSPDGYVFRAKSPRLLHDMLLYIVASDAFMNFAIEHSAGTHSKRVKWEDLIRYEFDLPPLEEQRRIAEVLGAARECLGAVFRLTHALEVLLFSTVERVADKAIHCGSTCALSDIVESDRPITYGILKPGTGFTGGVPVVKVKDFPAGSIIQDRLLLTDPKIDEEYRRSRLRAGDLIISIRGTIGRLAFVPRSLDGANITQDTARLSIRPEYHPEYIRALLGSTFVQRQITEFTTGLAVKGINIGELRRVRVPIVDLSTQVDLCLEIAAIQDCVKRCKIRSDECSSVKESLLGHGIKGGS